MLVHFCFGENSSQIDKLSAYDLLFFTTLYHSQIGVELTKTKNGPATVAIDDLQIFSGDLR